MRYYSAIIVVSAALLAVSVASAEEITDPHEVLNRYFEAAGGLDRLLAEESSYLEGTLAMAGLEGTLKVWTQRPGRSRVEVALGPLNITQGDNGEFSWVLDQNGKVQAVTNPDEATVKRRQVRRLIEGYAFAKPKSDVFMIALEGVEPVEDKDCYVVKITNNINVDSYTLYINAHTFLPEKAVWIEDFESRDVYYSDYRDLEGLLVAFWTKEVSHQTGQTQETQVTRYESNPTIDPILFEAPQQGAKDYRFAQGDRAENIPFEFVENHLFIPVIVAGKERLWVLDSGAGMTVLNKAFAEELGLELTGELKGRGAGGTVEVSLTAIPPYKVGSIEFQEQTVAAIDMDALIRRIGLDVVGILGFDFLSRFVTKVDYANELVSFYEPETFAYNGDGQVQDMHLDNTVFSVEATLDGIHSGTWLFDLGAGTTHLDGRYALREGYTERPGVIGMAHGAGNEYQIKKTLCDSLLFAGFTVTGPEISFAYGGSDTTFASDQIGVLGNSLFRNFVLYCDYAGERLIVERGEKYNQRWPRDNSGLQIAWTENHEIEVSFVSPDTPAEKAGFQKGDLLRSINGIDVATLDGVIAIRKLLKADPGTRYEFAIERAGESKKLQLTLRELL